MEVFLNRLVAVPDGSIRYCIHMVGIVHTVMAIVVTHGRHHNRDQIKFRKVCKLQDLSLGKEYVAHLEHICRMHIIVIFNISPVAFVNHAQEL